MLGRRKIKRDKRRDAIVLSVTMATTVGRCFDRSAAMRLIRGHTKQQINAATRNTARGTFSVSNSVMRLALSGTSAARASRVPRA